MSSGNSLHIGLIRWKSYPSDLHTRRVAKFLLDRGHQVHIICQNEGDQPSKEIINGVSVSRVPPKHKSVVRQLSYHATFIDFEWYKRIKNIINNNEFDILHVVDIYPIPTVNLANSNNIPIVADLRELYLESLKTYKKNMQLYQQLLRPDWRYKRMEKKSLERASGFITESAAATDHYVSNYEIDPNRIVEVRCVPEIKYLQGIKKNIKPQSYPNEFVVTYAGNFTAQRDLHTLIRAVAKLDETSPPIRLLMIGDGPEYENLINLVEELGISDKVEFTGWVSFERMFDYLAASDIGVCLCLPENKDSKTAKPNKIFQYMFMNLPVIVGDLRAMRQTITKTESGLVVEPTDVDSLVSAIRRLYQNKDLAHELGQNGHQSVLEELHFQREGESILELYRTILKGC